MKKLLIFPFNRETEPIVHSQSHLKTHTITGLVAFPGSGLVGHYYYADRQKIGVSCDFSEALQDCDAVLISDIWYEIDFQTLVLPKIMQAIGKGKMVFCSQAVFNKNRKKLSELLEASALAVLPEPTQSTGEPLTARIDIPVVYIAGMGQNTGKFLTEILLQNELREAGYKTSLIASRPEASLFGATAFPSYMFDGSISDAERIYSFSRLVKQIELQEHPELILIGLPGAAFPYSYKYTEDFGTVSLLVKYAAPPDAAILCGLCPVEEDSHLYFSGMDSLFEGRFGVKPIYHFISRYTFDFAAAENRKKYEYLRLPDKFVYMQQRRTGRPICSLVGDFDGAAYAAKLILSELGADTAKG